MFNYKYIKGIVKNLIYYGRARLVVTIYTNAIAFCIVDWVGVKYWQFAVVFVPLQFIADYFINKHVFNIIDKGK